MNGLSERTIQIIFIVALILQVIPSH
jgi:hypothetical protein